MNIDNVVKTIHALAGRVVTVKTTLESDWGKKHIYGGINEHTTLTGINFGPKWRDQFELQVVLTHKCPIHAFGPKIIRKAPYYCKQCTQCIISADQGPMMGLQVDLSIVPKMQISIVGSNYECDTVRDFDIGDLILTRAYGWVHKCTALDTKRGRFHQGKQTLTKLPFKCKECKKQIGEEGFDFKKMVAIASLLRIKK